MSDVKVKICGLTCLHDIEYVKKAAADYVGMVLFFPKSKRNISMDRARSLISALRDGEDFPKVVAVTVSPTLDQVKMIAEAGFDYIQIHGIMDKNIPQIVSDTAGLHIIRAYNETGDEELREIEQLKGVSAVEYYLFDASEPGSGRGFDWNRIPDSNILCKPYFLAGGLTPETVADAVKAVNPFAVDVSSGVEKDDQPSADEVSCGQSMKSEDKIRLFTDRARGVL